jgi:hypothetical protein
MMAFCRFSSAYPCTKTLPLTSFKMMSILAILLSVLAVGSVHNPHASATKPKHPRCNLACGKCQKCEYKDQKYKCVVWPSVCTCGSNLPVCHLEVLTVVRCSVRFLDDVVTTVTDIIFGYMGLVQILEKLLVLVASGFASPS